MRVIAVTSCKSHRATVIETIDIAYAYHRALSRCRPIRTIQKAMPLLHHVMPGDRHRRALINGMRTGKDILVSNDRADNFESENFI